MLTPEQAGRARACVAEPVDADALMSQEEALDRAVALVRTYITERRIPNVDAAASIILSLAAASAHASLVEKYQHARELLDEAFRYGTSSQQWRLAVEALISGGSDPR